MLDDRMKTAFSAAQDIIKQLITIATAVIAATVTFSGKGPSAILDFKAAGSATPIALGFLVISTGTGLAALMNITGAIGNSAIAEPTPYQPGIRLFAMLQSVCFVIGMLVMAIFVPHWSM